MILPLYCDHQAPNAMPDSGHRGLWYERFFNRYEDDWKIPDTAKAKWVEDNAKRAGDQSSLEQAIHRQLELVTQLNGRGAVFQADWHFATGLGLPHPVENGFAWHHTLGVPYLTGSAVKGLVRAWVEMWDETLDDSTRQQRIDIWFGTLKQAGAFVFFDALPIQPVRLRADVMTPHMGKWYEGGGEIQDWRREPEKVPADWHAPVPVPFLVADKPRLLFGIAPCRAKFATELPGVFKALQQALNWLGAGAKTAVGYGQMQEDESQTRQLHEGHEKRREQIAAAMAAKQREAERQAEREKLDPLERDLLNLIDARPDKNQSEIAYLIRKMKQGDWQGVEKQNVAKWLQTRMQATRGQWKPESRAKKPEKDREHQNTLLVMQWIKEGTS